MCFFTALRVLEKTTLAGIIANEMGVHMKVICLGDRKARGDGGDSE